MEPKFQDGDIIFDECGSYLVIDFEDVGLYTLEDLNTGEVSWFPQDYVESHMSYDEGNFDIDIVEQMDFEEIYKAFWGKGVDSLDEDDYNG